MGELRYFGRVSVELPDTIRQFASLVIRLFVQLPKNRGEMIVFGKLFLKSPHQLQCICEKRRVRAAM